MANPMIERFQSMLESGSDGVLLRFGLAKALMDEDREAEALPHLRRALEQDPDYSAAWKLLGLCYLRTERPAEALPVFEQGIEVARERGDKQAMKEMEVFARRARRALDT